MSGEFSDLIDGVTDTQTYFSSASSFVAMRKARFLDPSGSIREGTWEDDGVAFADRTFDLNDVDILPPVTPSKVVGVGFNYYDHLEEVNDRREREGEDLIPEPSQPLFFLMGPNSLAGHRDTVPVPAGIDTMDYEGEIGVVIGESCRNVTTEEAGDVVAGFTCVNDLSNHADTSGVVDFVRMKAFDSSTPVGPVISSPEQVPDDAAIEVRVNGEVRQQSSRDNLIFSINEIIADLSSYMTLQPGDLIATGSPAGSGALEDGDTVEITIDGVGTLEHAVEY